MRFLFTSAQIPGHLDWGGYLATASELVNQGHHVLWATGGAMLPTLARFNVPGHALAETGWLWPPPPPLQPAPDIDDAALQRMRMARALDQWLEEDRVAAAVDELLPVAAAFRPDLVVGEMFMSAAPILAEMLGVPFVVAGWPATRNTVHPSAQIVAAMAQERLARLFARFGVQGANWAADGPPAINSPHLHLTYWSERWYQGMPLLGQNRYVGGAAPAARPWRTPWLTQLPMDRPWVFITLGTSFTNDPNFFINSAHAVVKVGGLPILAVGQGFPNETLNQLQPKLPSPRVVTTEIDFSEVLPYAAVAIHHGGAGTTHALVTHAVPQIVVPHAADQGRQAEGVARTGVGVRLHPRQVVPDNLAKILQAMLPSDAPFRVNARRLQHEFAELGGVAKAAGLLVEAAGGERVKG
ncbi:MAG: glycosyltransferase family 1 protein [Caldilineaceae bacterium]|nr:glycosyltransferase family 1 protein [Caldilineaceae bacterium]MBP8108619.1 glycosyltransferase family 1 protein [Caldilineaceae bacterium]MBP8123172.1 glycosyltransferase family 1 protein [Caldilineaceae bacterium]MBP9072394.1 glycosyltransferase family 1 protein [Caldilineaceae bacterium]